MPVMVDSVVLLHAFGVALGRVREDAGYWEEARASHDLVENAEALCMSSINWFEVMRGMTEPQRAVLAKYRARIAILPVDARVAEQAAALHRATRSAGKVCNRCFGFLKPIVCSICGNQRSESQRSNDIVMVATADVTPDVPILYSWDNGVLALGASVVSVEIKRPPRPRGKQMALSGVVDLHRGGSKGRKQK